MGYHFPPSAPHGKIEDDTSTHLSPLKRRESDSREFFHYPAQMPIYEGSAYQHGHNVNQLHQGIQLQGTVPQLGGQSSQGYVDMYNTGFSFPKIPEFPAQPKFKPSHSKNNLSISLHFNLFNLSEEKKFPPVGQSSPHSLSIQNPQTQSVTHTQPQQLQRALGQDSVSAELLVDLVNVDGSNINNYLLSILIKITMPVPMDEFYNILYNSEKPVIPQYDRIDKTYVDNNEQSMLLISQLLNIFKNPNLLAEYFPNLDSKEIKLLNINYHELLRTFLAIKILFDVLIQLPPDADKEPQNYTIPRLSIYKTYYILCQKLIQKYPSASNTTHEQQKLILGQSKLGKLIKLVYPDLVIKRLGLRGESKYNYLGVLWNENVISDDIKDLSDNHELVELADFFNGEKSKAVLPKLGHKRTLSKSKVVKEEEPPSLRPPAQTTPSRQPLSSPNLSYVKPLLKFPTDENFTVLNDEENWFNDVRVRVYAKNPYILRETIHSICFDYDNLLTTLGLLTGLIEKVVRPLSQSETYEKTDLSLYLIIIIEILPYLLLIKLLTNIDFLKNLRLNLLHVINNFNGELSKLNSSKFDLNNLTIFLILLKKLINLNDLLITFIKLIMKDNTNSAMANDIENFLKVDLEETTTQQSEPLAAQSSQLSGMPSLPSGMPGLAADTSFPREEDDSFFLNLNSNLTQNSLNELSFLFKNDILLNDLLYTLIGYNFDPANNRELKSSISMNFINQEINIIDEFFKKDLLNFLHEDHSTDLSSSRSSVEPGASELVHKKRSSVSTSASTSLSAESILSPRELSKVYSLIHLIDKRLLSNHFKSKYPILIYNNFVNFILNDILKFIFLKQQQIQLQSLHQPATLGEQAQSAEPGQNSFGNWWVFNSFVQEYLSLVGEITGLQDLL